MPTRIDGRIGRFENSSFAYFPDPFWCDVQRGCDDKGAFSAGSDAFDLCDSQMAPQSTALVESILHVVGSRSEIQMIDIDAGWIVAPMTDKHFLWDGTTKQFPCDTMRSPPLTVGAEKTVTTFESMSRPFNTAVRHDFRLTGKARG